MYPETRKLSVDTFRTCFFWPLTLSSAACVDAEKSSLEQVHEQFRRLSGPGAPWKHVTDSLWHLSPKVPRTVGANDPDKLAYSEYIYFHDFVQSALFGSSSDLSRSHPLLLLERSDIAMMECEFGEGDEAWKVSLAVEKLVLYLLGPGVAVLALQVAQPENALPKVTLEQAMAFNDGARRSHVPFFFAKGNGDSSRDIAGGRLPHMVVWTMTDGKSHGFFRIDDDAVAAIPDKTGFESLQVFRSSEIAKTLVATDPRARQVLPLPHWQWLLNGNCDPDRTPPMTLQPYDRRDFHWRHFSDDRFPILTTIVLQDRPAYYALQKGDWMRLAFVDPPGGDPFAFAESFLDKDFEQHCYDRYHHPNPDQWALTDTPVRYLMCDYALTAVTYRSEERPNRFTFADELSVHMQRHYYQMFLLAVIDKATMLSLSSRISRAVEAYDLVRLNSGPSAGREAALSEAMQEIERDFLHYVHRFRFTGISGQQQAVEMFAKLRRVMSLDEIFDDIRTELETAVSFLSSRESLRSAEAAERLGVVATLGVVLGLVVAFLSMNIVTTAEVLVPKVPTDPGWARALQVFWLGLTLSAAGFGAGFLQSRLNRMTRRREVRPTEAFVGHGLFVIGLVGAVLMIGAVLSLGI